MNYKLTILKIAAIALMLCAPAMGESTKSFQLPALQAVLFPAVGSLAIQSQSSQSPTKRQPTKRQPLEDKLNRKFVLVLKLDDNQISKLRLEGSLITRIPPKFVNRVGKIRFQRSTSFLSEPLRVTGAKTVKNARLVSVEVDDSVLERLAYQPVEMAVFESGYNQIRLKFNSVGKIAGKLPDQEQPSADSKSGPLMYVRINEKRGIYGSLKDFETFSIKTQFGKVKIPTSEIAGIRFNDGSADTAFVVLKKGDVFSGQIDLETITVASRFGEQKLKLTRVESLSLGRQFVFLRDAINSKRWRLQSLLPAPSPTINPNFNRNPNGLSPITVDPSQLNSAPSVLFPQQPIGPNQRPIGFPN